jgi:TRAP-type C4-dicarboxylate transport system permease small subunit
MHSVIRWFKAAIYGLAVAGVLAYSAAALITVADIIGRQFGFAVLGVVDLVQLFVMMGAWFVIPYAFVVGAHVGVDLLVDHLPNAVAVPARVISASAAIVLLALMLRYGVSSFQTQMLFGDRSQQLGIPIMWYWLPLLLGLAVSIVASFVTLAGALDPDHAK